MSDAASLLRSSLARSREGRPYPGFRPFRRTEWPIFFGRERQVQDLLGLLAAQRFICIHGPSGGGKSSLIEAGLIATLQREHARFDTTWRINTFRPGTSPMWNLAHGLLRAVQPDRDPAVRQIVEAYSTLVRPGGSITKVAAKYGLKDANLLLVADQFEELFRFRMLGDRDEADRFVDLLLDVFDEQPKGIHVILATRTDFLGDCSDVVGLAEAVNAAAYLTPALTEDELRAAIRGPAALHGGKVDDAVVEQMLRDSAGQPDRLPILQHTLMRCWDVAVRRSTPGKITLQLYNSSEIEGVANALHHHAEEVMSSPELDDLEHDVELVFKALTELDIQGRAIRRPLTWAELLAESGHEPPADLSDENREDWWKKSQSLPMARVVNRFRQEGTGFLGRPGPDEKELTQDTLVDVAHEALIRRWRRLNRLARPGTGGPRQREGWLWEEAADGNQYRALLLDAQSKMPIINPWNLPQRVQWWRRQPRTAAWARRMAGDRDATNQDAKAGLDRITRMFRRSRALIWGSLIAIIVIVGSVGYFAIDYVTQRVMFTEQLERTAKQLQERDDLHRADLQRLIGISADLQETQNQLKTVAAALDRANARAAAAEQAGGGRTAPAVPPPTPVDLATEVAPTARPIAETSAGAAPSCQGAVWIGSGNAANLRFAAGDGRSVPLSEVKPNQTFASGVNLRLRRGPPLLEGYIHQEQIGIIPVGTQITALGTPVRYDRPSGPQYWLNVSVPGQVCSLVYFQFTGGTTEDARAMAAALTKQGYLVPGQQQLSSAQGLAQVRFYYPEDRDAAVQLAKDATANAQALGLAAGRQVTVADYTDWKRQKPPRGTLELWLDLSNN